jgi:hypothetical protein
MTISFGITYATVSDISKLIDATAVGMGDDGWVVWICAMLLWTTIQSLVYVARPKEHCARAPLPKRDRRVGR